MSVFLDWLSEEKNQKTLKFVGSGLAVVVGALWTAYHYAPSAATMATHDCNVIGSIVNGTVTQDCHTTNQAVHDSDGLYQGEKRVGKVIDPLIDKATHRITFGVANFESYPDPALPIDYGSDMKLRCDVSFLERLRHTLGSITIQEFPCTIVGPKDNSELAPAAR